VNNKTIIGIITTNVLLVVLLCGCSESENYSLKVMNTEFLGSWTGNMQYISKINLSDFYYPENSNHTNTTNMLKFGSANITKLDFKEEIVFITITTENDSITISNSYSIEGNQLSLSIDFKGQRSGGMQPLEGREIPPDWERPIDGELPFRGERPTRMTTYNYSFNEDKTILFLNENPFYKINF
jgi:hypothetical protein